MPPKKLALQVKAKLWEKGQKALEMAKQKTAHRKHSSELLQERIDYFMSGWEDVVHPALLALACEAVGGNADSTLEVGVSFVLLAGGADIHDDLIDESTFKYNKQTVFGKFGKDIAILVGDALIFEGLLNLASVCQNFPAEQRIAVFDLTEQAFFGISTAEAKESSLKRKTNRPSSEEFLDMINIKAAVAEATMKVGAVLGGGTTEQVSALGHFGRTLGVLLTIRDEFIDLFELNEVKNRIKKECLPLPILCTLEDQIKAEEIKPLLAGRITRKNLERLLDIVLDSEQTKRLRQHMCALIEEEKRNYSSLKTHRTLFNLMLNSTVEDL